MCTEREWCLLPCAPLARFPDAPFPAFSCLQPFVLRCHAASSGHRVYRRLESLSIDEAEVSREFLAVLGADKLGYLQLVHQLIVCEESMHADMQ